MPLCDKGKENTQTQHWTDQYFSQTCVPRLTAYNTQPFLGNPEELSVRLLT